MSLSYLNDIVTLASTLLTSPSLKLASNAQALFIEQPLGSSDTPISSTLSVFGTLNTAPFDSLSLQLTNTGIHPLTAFAVQAQFATAGNWFTIFDQPGDFMAYSPGSPLQNASGDLTTLASGVHGWLNLDVSYYMQVRLLAAASAGTTLTTLAGLKTQVKFKP